MKRLEQVESVIPDPVHPLNQRGEQLLLASKVVVEGRFSDAHPLSHLTKRRLVEALLREEIYRRLHDPVSGRGGVGVAGLVDLGHLT